VVEEGAEPDLSAILHSLAGEDASFGNLARILSALPVGLALHDAGDDDFRLLYLNSAAAPLLTVSAPDAVDQPLAEVFGGCAGLLPLFREVRATAEPLKLNDFRNPESGLSYNIEAFPIADAAGRVCQILATWQDVSELAEARNSLRELLATTEAMSRPLPLHEIAKLAAEQIAPLLPGVECGVFLMPRGRPQVVRTVAASGAWGPRLGGQEFEIAGTPSERARRALAARAVVGAARADDRPADLPAAAVAGLARAVVDDELVLHAALAAGAIPIRAQRRPMKPDGLPQDPSDRLVQPCDLLGLQRTGASEGVDPCAPQGLGRVDVPDARDAALVQQQGLDRGPPAPP